MHVVSIPVSPTISIAANHWPGSGSAVVLAHGGGQTRHSWGGTAQTLAGFGFDVLSIDLRGHGDSGWASDGDYSMDRFADDAAAILGWIGRPTTWVGASLGGMTGLLASARSHLPIEALVLVDITARPARAGVERILGFMGENMQEGFESLDDAADSIARYQPHRPRPRDLSGLAKNLRQGADGRWRWHWDPNFLTSRVSMTNSGDRYNSLEHAARALRIPTLLVRGRQSDLVTEAEAREFLELVPHAEYVDVVDAAHMVAGDKNDVFTNAVVAFLRRGSEPATTPPVETD